MGQSYDWETFGITLAIDVVLCVVFVIVFNILRSTQSYRRFYASRYYVKVSGYRRPKPLALGWGFRWIKTIFGYTDEEILAVAGYDGLVFLQIFKFGVQLFGILFVFLWIFVLPVNWSADYVEESKADPSSQAVGPAASPNEDETEVTNFDKVTMANIEEKSDRLWVHLIAVYLVTFITLHLLHRYHEAAVRLRIEYLSSTKKGMNSHTIFITDIPGIRFGLFLDRLMQSWLFKFFPGSVKKKIQDTVDSITNLAIAGVDAAGNAAVGAVAKTGLTGADSSTRVALLDEASSDSIETFVRPVAAEITDMDPSAWVQKRLAQGLSHEQVVEEMYKEVFPQGEVVGAKLVLDTDTLTPLVEKLNKTVQALEDLIDQYAIDIKENKEIKKRTARVIPITEGKWATDKYGQKPTKVDAMELMVQRIQNLKQQILDEDEKARTQITGSAFVSFNTRWSQVVGASAFFHHFESVWNSNPAPHPAEIVWENLKMRTWERTLRTVVSWILFALLCAFFMIPIGAAQALIELDQLENYAVIGDIVTFPLVKSLIAGILPNLVLNIFLAVLPIILHMMCHFQGIISKATIEQEVTRKYFIFLMITVFIASFTARTVLQQLDSLTSAGGFSEVIDLLGSGAPQSSTFFLYFIMTDAFIGSAFENTMVIDLAIAWILAKLSGTQRAKDRLWHPKPLLLGAVVSRHTLAMFLGLVFCIVNPFIVPVALIYFSLMLLFNRYKTLYTKTECYQSGGQLWTQVSLSFALSCL